VGTRKILAILTKICHGQGTHDDLERLKRLCETVRTSSLCGLGTTAPNPVLTTMRYFEREYAAHVDAGLCPAGICSMRPATATRAA
jgi:NADH:ubiquinone oxidoreductase subunit F (NADH-binding)